MANTFWKKLERNYIKQNIPVEVFGFGMSGYDAAMAYQTLQYHVMQYKPDLVIWAFLPGNDIKDSLRELTSHPWKPYYTLNEKDELILDQSFHSYVDSKKQFFDYYFRALRNSSYFLQFLDKNVRNPIVFQLKQQLELIVNYFANTSKSEKTRNDYAKIKPVKAGLSTNICLETIPGTPMDKAWNITEKLILAMNELCKAKEVNFMVLGVSISDIHYSKENNNSYDLFYPEKRTAAFLKKHAIDYLPTAYALVEANKKGVYFHGFKRHGWGHWNENGHDEVGKMLFSFINKRGLLDLK